jgi:methyl-accepting chemotaxis protein
MASSFLDPARRWKAVWPLATGMPVTAACALSGLPASLSLGVGLVAAVAFILGGLPGRRVAARETAADGHDLTSAEVAPPVEKPADIAPAAIEPTEGLSEHLAAYQLTLERASHYTSSVTVDAEDAAMRIIDGLKEIEASVGDLLSFLETSGTNEKVIEIIENTDRQLSRNRKLIEDFVSRRDQDIERWHSQVGEIDRMTDDLGHAIDGIRNIASQTRLLALNAAIEASHAGKHGAGFAVVASEVKNLSDASNQTAHRVGEGLGKLRDSIRDNLTVLVTKRLEGEQRELNQIAASISEVTEMMERLIAHQRDTLGKVQFESNRMISPVLQLLGSIQFQDVARQRIQHVEMFFAKARKDIAAVAAALGSNREIPTATELRSALAEEGPAAPRQRGTYTEIELF